MTWQACSNWEHFRTKDDHYEALVATSNFLWWVSLRFCNCHLNSYNQALHSHFSKSPSLNSVILSNYYPITNLPLLGKYLRRWSDCSFWELWKEWIILILFIQISSWDHYGYSLGHPYQWQVMELRCRRCIYLLLLDFPMTLDTINFAFLFFYMWGIWPPERITLTFFSSTFTQCFL